MPLGAWSAAALISASSPLSSFQPRAPRFDCIWATFLAPGIGIVPWHMHQLMAICTPHHALSDVNVVRQSTPLVSHHDFPEEALLKVLSNIL